MNYAGQAVAGVGNIDGKGADDVLVGAFGTGYNGPNSGSAYIVNPQPANLRVKKIAAPEEASPGDVVDFTIAAFNEGPGGATKVQAVDTLPPDFVVQGFKPSQGTCEEPAGQVLRCDLGTIAARAGAIVVVRGDRPFRLGHHAQHGHRLRAERRRTERRGEREDQIRRRRERTWRREQPRRDEDARPRHRLCRRAARLHGHDPQHGHEGERRTHPRRHLLGQGEGGRSHLAGRQLQDRPPDHLPRRSARPGKEVDARVVAIPLGVGELGNAAAAIGDAASVHLPLPERQVLQTLPNVDVSKVAVESAQSHRKPRRPVLKLRLTPPRRVSKAGAEITYRLTVSAHRHDAHNVTVCDRPGARLRIVEAPGGRKVGAGACWRINQLRVDHSRVFTFRVRIDPGFSNGELHDHATATAADARARPDHALIIVLGRSSCRVATSNPVAIASC